MILVILVGNITPFSTKADMVTWTVNGDDMWNQAYALNDQNDFILDQQTGSGSVS